MSPHVDSTVKKNNRFEAIDLLRGLAILVMILIHTNAYFLSDKIAFTLWNYGEFAVPVFVFCSSFLFFQKHTVITPHTFFPYIKKRFLRLLIPYYIFLLFFFPLLFFLERQKLTFKYIFQSVFLISGVDINWLVLLFLMFSFLLPVLSFFAQKKRSIFICFSLVSFLSSVLFLFIPPPFHDKYILWLPWSIIIIYAWCVVKYGGKKWFYPSTFISALILFMILSMLHISPHQSMNLHENKYPPNVYFLSFGVLSLSGLLYLAQRGVFNPFRKLLIFLSLYSYQIYFIHYFLLIAITICFRRFVDSWTSLFLVVFFLTMFVQLAWNKVGNIRINLRKKVLQ